MTKWILVLGLAAAAAAAVAQLASGKSSGTFPLNAEIRWSGGDSACPAGKYSSPTVECHPHRGGPVAVPGIGFVSEEYLYAVETAPGAACPDGFYVIGYDARLKVADKGDIYLALGAANGCLQGPPGDTVLTPTQPFTIIGGSGVYVAASGTGMLTRRNPARDAAGNGTAIDIWQGTMTVPGVDLDLTPPAIAGASDKVVRVPRNRIVRVSRRKTRRVPLRHVRVRYTLTATDDVDGARPVTCNPMSGSRFRVGRSAVVRCSASDKSANTVSAQFTVTVKRR